MKILLSLLGFLLCLNVFASTYNMGFGVAIGNPTGLNVKHWLSDDHAVDGGFGMSIGKHTEGSLHSDYLLHKKGALILKDVYPLDIFYGVGGRMEFADSIQLGIRVPVGLAHTLDSGKADVFGEIAPILDFVGTTGIEINFGIGGRYYF